MTLCKEPNGYLQGDDFDPDSFVAYTPHPQMSKASSDEIIAVWASYAKKLDLDFKYVRLHLRLIVRLVNFATDIGH